jgi:hypothetical protein
VKKNWFVTLYIRDLSFFTEKWPKSLSGEPSAVQLL